MSHGRSTYRRFVALAGWAGSKSGFGVNGATSNSTSQSALEQTVRPSALTGALVHVSRTTGLRKLERLVCWPVSLTTAHPVVTALGTADGVDVAVDPDEHDAWVDRCSVGVERVAVELGRRVVAGEAVPRQRLRLGAWRSRRRTRAVGVGACIGRGRRRVDGAGGDGGASGGRCGVVSRRRQRSHRWSAALRRLQRVGTPSPTSDASPVVVARHPPTAKCRPRRPVRGRRRRSVTSRLARHPQRRRVAATSTVAAGPRAAGRRPVDDDDITSGRRRIGSARRRIASRRRIPRSSRRITNRSPDHPQTLDESPAAATCHPPTPDASPSVDDESPAHGDESPADAASPAVADESPAASTCHQQRSTCPSPTCDASPAVDDESPAVGDASPADADESAADAESPAEADGFTAASCHQQSVDESPADAESPARRRTNHQPKPNHQQRWTNRHQPAPRSPADADESPADVVSPAAVDDADESLPAAGESPAWAEASPPDVEASLVAGDDSAEAVDESAAVVDVSPFADASAAPVAAVSVGRWTARCRRCRRREVWCRRSGRDDRRRVGGTADRRVGHVVHSGDVRHRRVGRRSGDGVDAGVDRDLRAVEAAIATEQRAGTGGHSDVVGLADRRLTGSGGALGHERGDTVGDTRGDTGRARHPSGQGRRRRARRPHRGSRRRTRPPCP